MKVSYRKLRAKGACDSQLNEFKRLFGTASVEVTPALCRKYAGVFDWDWAADNLLSEALQDQYHEARLWYKYARPHALLTGAAKRDALWNDWKKKNAALFARLAARC
jgi:hypothetical protein